MSAGAALGACEPRTLAPLGRRLAAIADVEDHGAYRLVWALDGEGPADPRPGQFYMLASAERWGGEDGRPYLPRALSHCHVVAGRGEENGAWAGIRPAAHHVETPRLGFLLDAIGPGTEHLAALEAGEEIWVAGPFGVGFRTPGRRAGARVNGREVPGDAGGPTAPRPLLVGGGIGVAPILALADQLGPSATVLLGFRSQRHALAARLFEREPRLCTDDGSLGRHALVTDLLREELDRDADAPIVFACGPPLMLEAVRALCDVRGVAAQLALESGMACGYGACFGCVVPTRDGFVRLCLEGPVLEASRLDTALFPGAGR